MKNYIKLTVVISILASIVSCTSCTKDELPTIIVEKDSIYTYWDTISVDVLLETVQKTTFKYFWDFADANSGLARERNTSGSTVTTGGSGFGIMSIIVATERGWITRAEAIERMQKISNFLTTCDRFHGAWPHWLDGNTGITKAFSTKDDGGDLVETAFLVQGLLTAREYFNGSDQQELALRNSITNLWETVEWDWYTNGKDYLYWHWSPNYGWEMNHAVYGWNEAMMTYLLAIASPTHPIDASFYNSGWAGSNYLRSISFSQHGDSKGGPLFFTHYSFLGMDPHFADDFVTQMGHADYFELCKEQSLANRQHCIDNSGTYPNYSKDCWGLTASDTYNGYTAHSPDNDNGTISPTAAMSSITYTPDESIAFIRHMFNEYEDEMWGEYGFHDAFNVKQNWYADSYLAIDQGPVICNIENYRTQLLWHLFMQNEEITSMMNKIGLTKTNQ